MVGEKTKSWTKLGVPFAIAPLIHPGKGQNWPARDKQLEVQTAARIMLRQQPLFRCLTDAQLDGLLDTLETPPAPSERRGIILDETPEEKPEEKPKEKPEIPTLE